MRSLNADGQVLRISFQPQLRSIVVGFLVWLTSELRPETLRKTTKLNEFCVTVPRASSPSLPGKDES